MNKGGENRTAVSALLAELNEAARAIEPRLRRAIRRARGRVPRPGRGKLDERDCILITYPDMVREAQEPPLRTLLDFSEKHLSGIVSSIHILPFFPSSSDDGFSVIDYRAVDPALGTWDDIRRLSRSFRLMVDAVFNHVSAHSAWFQGFLRDEPGWRDAFVVVREKTDLSRVVRPRSHPLLTAFATSSGERMVWTTFSPDQVDLNYANPGVLASVVETLLFYAEQGAGLVRLDAIAYVWKEPGTPCINLPRAHLIVRLFRAVLDAAAPHVALVTETNVPHDENVSYFGDGTNEAQLVYNFSLPPLVLHSFAAADASVLARWAAGVPAPSPGTTFLNFLASHDGIGVVPARGVLSDSEIQALVDGVIARGGRVSYKSGPDGSLVPYELNISLWDALAQADQGEPLGLSIRRFLAAHAIIFSLRGVPAVYFHSLFGSSGWTEGVALSGINRTINRQKCDRKVVERELRDVDSRRARVFAGMKGLLAARSSSTCFHPQGGQRVHPADGPIFTVVRTSPDGGQRLFCLHNVSAERRSTGLDPRDVLGSMPGEMHDIVSGRKKPLNESGRVVLEPYETAWLRTERSV